jgi:hypothetical protein
MLVFSTQLCDLYSTLVPLSPSLWFSAPPPPPSLCELVCCIQVYSVRGEGYGVLDLRQLNTCRKVPLQVNFLDDDI